jgi:hypothetical protein
MRLVLFTESDNNAGPSCHTELVYSLVSAPVLGFDLARLDGGATTAELLLAALTLVPEDLDVLAARLPDGQLRAELWQQVDAADLRRYHVHALAGLDPVISVALVERAPIGTLDALLRCLRHDVLDWTWTGGDDPAGGPAADPAALQPRAFYLGALDPGGLDPNAPGSGTQTETAARASALLCDAAVAAYLREELAAPTRRRLAAGWVAAVRRLPARPADLGPQHRIVAATLDRVRRAGSAELARLGQAADRNRGQIDWATAMHSASWAVYLSGRVRAAAAAQLQLVLAVRDGAVPVAELAAGSWNALSGAVQALLVRDLLDVATTHQLIGPYLAAFGPADLD